MLAAGLQGRTAAGATVGRPARGRRCLAVRATASGEGALCNAAGRRQVLTAGGLALGGLLLPGGAVGATPAAADEPASIYDLSALMYDKEVSFDKYRGQVRSSWSEQAAALLRSTGRLCPPPPPPPHPTPCRVTRRSCWCSTWRQNDPYRTSTTR